VGERPLGCPRRPLGRPLEIYGQHYGAAAVAASMAGGLRPVRNPSSSVVQEEVGGEVVPWWCAGQRRDEAVAVSLT
jgi:hypothetical protein